MQDHDLDNRFAYHAPKDEETKIRHENIRGAARIFAEAVNLNCPEGREKSLAMTKIEEAMMWSNGAIARQETPDA